MCVLRGNQFPSPGGKGSRELKSGYWVRGRSSLGKSGSLSTTSSRLAAQLEKVYDPKNEEDDMREMEEERLRMREHVMKNVRRGPRAGVGGRAARPVTYPCPAPQVDTNQDRLVTLEEFLASTQRKEFGDTGEGWEVRSWGRSGS